MKLELQKNLLNETGGHETNNETNNETEKRIILKTSRLPLSLALLVPVFAIFAYTDYGLSWGAINDLEVADELRAADPHDEQSMRDSVEKLAERLKSQPDNHEGLFLLAQSYLNFREYDKSAEVFKRLLVKFPGDHGLSSYYAEAVYLADDRTMTDRVNKAIESTLALNPNDITMLEIKALALFQSGDLNGALQQFRKAIAAGADPERAQLIKDAIKRIEEDIVASGLTPEVPSQSLESTIEPAVDTQQETQQVASKQLAGTSEENTGRKIQVLVEVADSVEAGASASVFVFARAVQGPPMPLAVQRLVKGALPRLVELDESMAMMPGMGLANFDQVQVVARISSTGIANVSPDDYQALSATIDLTKDNSVIKLRIEKRVKDHNN